MFDKRRGPSITKKCFRVFSLCILLMCPIFAFGADYPTKPISLLCPYAAGGPVDLTGRVLAEIAKEILGQPVVVVNKPGGGGIIAQSVVAKEKPDGYTLAITSDGAFTQIPQMREVAFDPLNDFDFIIQHLGYAGGIACREERPWKTMGDLVLYSKQNPGKVTYGVAGTGGIRHIDAEIIAAKEGVKWRMVPFDGAAQVISALLGGHIDFLLSDAATWKPYVKTGEVKALAIERGAKEDFPRVITFGELGYEAAGVTGPSFGIIAPKGTPAEIVQRLHDSLKRAIDDSRYESYCIKLGVNKTYASGEEFYRKIKSQYEVRGRIIKALGLAKSK